MLTEHGLFGKAPAARPRRVDFPEGCQKRGDDVDTAKYGRRPALALAAAGIVGAEFVFRRRGGRRGHSLFRPGAAGAGGADRPQPGRPARPHRGKAAAGRCRSVARAAPRRRGEGRHGARPIFVCRKRRCARRCARSRSTPRRCAPQWRQSRVAHDNFDQVLHDTIAAAAAKMSVVGRTTLADWRTEHQNNARSARNFLNTLRRAAPALRRDRQ